MLLVSVSVAVNENIAQRIQRCGENAGTICQSGIRGKRGQAVTRLRIALFQSSP